jgi:thiopurine S-methyltransferase
MDTQFWHQRWENNDIGFHEDAPNPLLTRHVAQLALARGSRVFVPLCGKTRDIHWLLANGYQVCGVELSKIAVEQLFKDLGVRPDISRHGELARYQAPALDIYAGDIFCLSSQLLGPVDATYDRAALVALDGDLRERYATHVTRITRRAPQLLICYEYAQNLMAGPPFSIRDDEVRRHYGEHYALTLVEKAVIAGGFKGKLAASENVWLLA